MNKYQSGVLLKVQNLVMNDNLVNKHVVNVSQLLSLQLYHLKSGKLYQSFSLTQKGKSEIDFYC